MAIDGTTSVVWKKDIVDSFFDWLSDFRAKASSVFDLDNLNERKTAALIVTLFVTAVIAISLISYIKSRYIVELASKEVGFLLDDSPWLKELVELDGRDVALRGIVSSERLLEEVEAKINRLQVVGKVDNRIVVESESSSEVFLANTKEQITILGVTKAESWYGLKSALQPAVGDKLFIDQITVDNSRGRLLWENIVADLWSALGDSTPFVIQGNDELVRIFLPASGALIDSTQRRVQLAVRGVVKTEVLPLVVEGKSPAHLMLSIFHTKTPILVGSVGESSQEDMSAVTQAMVDAFGLNPSSVQVIKKTNGEIGDRFSKKSKQLAHILPQLMSVRDLSIVVFPNEALLFGFVTDPFLLEKIKEQIRKMGLSDYVRNNISVKHVRDDGLESGLSSSYRSERPLVSALVSTTQQKLYLTSAILKLYEKGVDIVIDVNHMSSGGEWVQHAERILKMSKESENEVAMSDFGVLVSGENRSGEEKQVWCWKSPFCSELDWRTISDQLTTD